MLAMADEHKGIAALACESLQIDGNELRSELIALSLKAKSAANAQLESPSKADEPQP